MRTKTPEWKLKLVDKLAEQLKKHKVIGVIDLSGLPASKLQRIRGKLEGKVNIRMTKKSIVKKALEKTGNKELADQASGMAGLLMTNMDPFKLSKLLDKTKTQAPAKPGQTAPQDIEVKEGITAFMPGPIMTELQEVGIKTKVQQGKIAIAQDATLARKGEEISKELANVLLQLGIEPMRVGITILSVSSEGKVYKAQDIEVDEEKYINNIITAYNNAKNLAFNASIMIKEIIDLLLSKAGDQAKNLAYNARIITKENIDVILSLANSQMMELAEKAHSKDPKALSESLAELIVKKAFGG